MQVHEIMTERPMCCTPDTTLDRVAKMMVEHDCGCIPVVETQESRKLVGVVTDRDICCRAVATGRNPLEMTADDIMSRHVVAVTPETDVAEVTRVMEQYQVRRVPVVTEDGRCCGIVAQADIARHASERTTADVVKEISEPTDLASRTAGA